MDSSQPQSVIITGAARGLGFSMAQTFGQRGYRVAMLDVSPDLNASAASLRELGLDVRAFTCDVSNPEQATTTVTQVKETFGRIDVLINNAGILKDASLLKMEPAAFDAVISVNLKGVFLMGQACARVMAEQKSGRIINISSVAARGNFGQSNYSAAKAGVVGLTKTWAKELSRYTITVNAIAPGLIETEMTASIPSPIREDMIKLIPLGRMGTPQEVADLAYFLASPEAAYIQGEVIDINGGFLM